MESLGYPHDSATASTADRDGKSIISGWSDGKVSRAQKGGLTMFRKQFDGDVTRKTGECSGISNHFQSFS
jgi:hypothetical protein